MERGLIVVPIGPLQSNMYIITGESGIFIIDPSVSLEATEEFLREIPDFYGISRGKADVEALLLTHGHHDHIKYISEWQDTYPLAKVFFSSNDKDLLGNGFMNCSYMEGSEILYDFKFTNLAGTYGQTIYKDDDISVKVFETPGHTLGKAYQSMTAKEKKSHTL